MKKVQKAVTTRMVEIQKRTLDPKEMLNMYIAEKVVKKYKEDFVDSDTGQVVSIDRSQVLYNQGTLINQDILAKIRFDIESGDLKEPILISNQLRNGFEWKQTFLKPWSAKVKIEDKNLKFLLYAQNIDNALVILRDYIELNYKGGFAFLELKEFTDCVILEDTLSDKMSEDDVNMAYLRGEIDMRTYINATSNNTQENTSQSNDKKYYQIDFKVEWNDGESAGEHISTYVVNTFDTERAMTVVKAYLKMQDEQRAEIDKKDGREHNPKTFSLLIEKAGTIPVGCFIPLEFSQVYAEK